MIEFSKVEKELFDVNNENLQKLANLFPGAVKDGQLDVNALKEELGQFEEVGQEKYELNWAGKQNAKKEARKNVLGKTLRYIKGDGVDEDTTQNLYIEGDNLEVLKLLRKNYYGSIKMIYIDPPYNTGNDFVYNDNFTATQEEIETAQGERDEYGEKLQKNTKDSAKYHTNWLNMMYPRLQLAKDLLTNDGAIFISIGDDEVTNLAKICDEIFGVENFINIISAKTKNIAGASGGGEDKRLKKNIEYILMYAKNYNIIEPFKKIYNKTEISELLNKYKEEDISWKYTSILRKRGEKVYLKSTTDGDGNEIKIYKRINPEYSSISQIMKEENLSETAVYVKYFNDIYTTAMPQSSIRVRVMDAVNEEKNVECDLYSIEYMPKTGKNKGKIYEQFYKGDKYRLFTWFSDVAEIENGIVYKKDMLGTLWDKINLNNLTKEGNVKYDNGKKPIELITKLIEMVSLPNDIICDFFSGSATTAHAVMELNAKDNENRKFILVQLPEQVLPITKDNVEYLEYLNTENIEPYVTELGKERIRRAGKKIKEELEQQNRQLKPGEEVKKVPDIGFKVFRVGETTLNWEKLALQGADLQHDYLPDTSSKDRLDFTPDFKNDLNVVYEIMLRQEGLPLTSKIETLKDIGNRTYLVADSYLISLEENITAEMTAQLSQLNPIPTKFIFRDSAFNDDIDFKDETFRRLNIMIDKNSYEEKKTYTVEFI